MIIAICIFVCIINFVLIYIHELGHCFFLKLFGVKINNINIGIGPVLFRGEKVILKLVPLGGYSFFSKENYESISTWKKIFVIIGGPLFNILFGILFLFVSVLIDENIKKNYFFIQENRNNNLIYFLKEINEYKVNNLFDVNNVTKLLRLEKSNKKNKITVNAFFFNKKMNNKKKIKTTLAFLDNLQIKKYELPSNIINSIFLKIKISFKVMYLKLKGKRIIKKDIGNAQTSSFTLIKVFWGVGFISILLGIINLVPIKIGIQESDGLSLIKLSFQKKGSIDG